MVRREAGERHSTETGLAQVLKAGVKAVLSGRAVDVVVTDPPSRLDRLGHELPIRAGVSVGTLPASRPRTAHGVALHLGPRGRADIGTVDGGLCDGAAERAGWTGRGLEAGATYGGGTSFTSGGMRCSSRFRTGPSASGRRSGLLSRHRSPSHRKRNLHAWELVAYLPHDALPSTSVHTVHRILMECTAFDGRGPSPPADGSAAPACETESP